MEVGAIAEKVLAAGYQPHGKNYRQQVARGVYQLKAT